VITEFEAPVFRSATRRVTRELCGCRGAAAICGTVFRPVV